MLQLLNSLRAILASSSLFPAALVAKQNDISQEDISDVSRPRVKDEIRSIILNILNDCSMPYPNPVEDSKDFQAVCMKEALRRGYHLTVGDDNVKYLIPLGSETAYLFYPGLRQKHSDLLTLIGLYFAWLFYIDDTVDRDYEAICEFNDRFVQGREQKSRALDHLVEVTLEMTHRHSGEARNLIIAGTLDYVTGTMIERVVRQDQIHPEAEGFHTYLKTLVGANRPVCLLAFPPEIPIQQYIQAIPDMLHFVDNFSDILSFYKEDLAGETSNRISHLSVSRGVPKLEVLRGLAKDAVRSYGRVLDILPASSTDVAKEIFQGVLAIHVSSKRYRFDDLDFA